MREACARRWRSNTLMCLQLRNGTYTNVSNGFAGYSDTIEAPSARPQIVNQLAENATNAFVPDPARPARKPPAIIVLRTVTIKILCIFGK